MKYKLMLFSGLLFLTGCNAVSIGDGLINVVPDSDSRLEDKWSLVSYGYQDGEKSELLEDSHFTIDFTSPNAFSGSDSCNSHGGSYEADEDTLTTGPIISTEAFCFDNEQSSFALNALANSEAYLIEDGIIARTLTILADDSAELIFELYEEVTLENKWNLLSYGPQGEEKTKILESTNYNLNFTSGTEVSGFDSCNSFSGSYESDENSLNFGLIISTQKACISPDDQEQYGIQQSFYENAFKAVESYLIEDNTLTITARDSSQLIYILVEPESEEVTLENSWNLISYGFRNEEKSDLADDLVYSLRFSSTLLGGSTPCNSYSGSYEADESNLTTGPILSTQAVCKGIDRFYFNALQNAESYLIDDGFLTITANDDSQITFEQVAELALKNEWNLISFVYLGEDSRLPVGTQFSLDFASSTKVTGRCENSEYSNKFSNTYASDESNLSVERITSFAPICFNIPEASSAYYIFENSESYLIEGNILTIIANDGDQLTLEKIDELNLENEWNLISYGYADEEKNNLNETSYSLNFNSSSNFSGSASCNSYTGSYKSDENSLSIETIISTEAFCLDNETYSFFTNALATAESYIIEGNILTITASDSAQLIFEIAPELVVIPLQNEWQLISYGYENEEKVLWLTRHTV